jgi:hypothetical protein
MGDLAPVAAAPVAAQARLPAQCECVMAAIVAQRFHLQRRIESCNYQVFVPLFIDFLAIKNEANT